MDFNVLSAKRYSVRNFSHAPVEAEKLALILEAGRNAPTAGNRQPQRILVITRRDGIAKVDRCTPCRFGAPLVLIVCYDQDECWVRDVDGEKSGPTDAAIVAAQMTLQAADTGLGSTWVMRFDPAAVKSEFALPENIVPAAMLVMGRPAPGAAPHERHFLRKTLERIAYFEEFPKS
ncbi:MAG: nitroreductase family protein [Treponema sp.]|jgi:nitroreductase|nr:nitroreductase family protein [Treponema sp.]